MVTQVKYFKNLIKGGAISGWDYSSIFVYNSTFINNIGVAKGKIVDL